MNHFYVTLPSDSSGYYFLRNKISNLRIILATPIELEPDKWEVGLVEIPYLKGHGKRMLHKTLRLDATEIKFPVKNYESLYGLTANLTRFLKSCIRKEVYYI
jgi:hypothetical protein